MKKAHLAVGFFLHMARLGAAHAPRGFAKDGEPWALGEAGSRA
jgi:hypothetical protein